jgi:geranylgeranyl diphosphate synthase type I
MAKNEIEIAAEQYFDNYSSETTDNSFIQASLKSLREQNEGGKRIRGAMIKLGEKIASHGKNDNYLPIAVGYELFQTAVLIHDDIIDKGDTRRNKTTIHVESAKNIKSSINISDSNAEHFGILRALCIGDYGFFIAYQFLAKCKVDSSILVNVYNFYSKILTTTCEGEIMDSILPFEKISILDNYKEYIKTVTQIYEYKTAWYTLAGPIMLGAICGGANDKLTELLKSIAIPLGIAFQIKDDLLGIYSSESILGKSVLLDIRENKQTLMFGFAYKNANDQQRVLLDKHYGKEDANESDLEIIRKLFEEIGAKKYAEDEIQLLSDHSRALIINDLIDKEYQSILNGLINYLIGRDF